MNQHDLHYDPCCDRMVGAQSDGTPVEVEATAFCNELVAAGAHGVAEAVIERADYWCVGMVGVSPPAEFCYHRPYGPSDT